MFIEGKEKRLDLNETLTIDKENSEKFLKSATVYWNYNNVFSGENETFTYDGNNKSINPGYWTFDMITKKFKSIGGYKSNKNSRKWKMCYSIW